MGITSSCIVLVTIIRYWKLNWKLICLVSNNNQINPLLLLKMKRDKNNFKIIKFKNNHHLFVYSNRNNNKILEIRLKFSKIISLANNNNQVNLLLLLKMKRDNNNFKIIKFKNHHHQF